MGNMEVPTQNNQAIKMPMGTYEFGANLVTNKVEYQNPLMPSRGSPSLQFIAPFQALGHHCMGMSKMYRDSQYKT
jgi:hypothetical protein